MTQIVFPAEWHPQDAILLTWPHAQTDWSDQLETVCDVYFEISKAILSTQNLIICCEDAQRLAAVQNKLKPFAEKHKQHLSCYEVPADDTWARDHGPICVYKHGKPTLLDFTFNAWGDKFASQKDDLITSRLYALEAFSGAAYENIKLILEGGSVESDGQGTLLTTSTCLLTDTRNNTFDKQSLTAALKHHLGVQRILWLEHGYLSGDDTDAHIDTLARFCDEHTICYVSCDDESDEHFFELQKMREELESFRTSDGQPYKLVALPMAEAIYEDGDRLPATYANFLITNASILLPIYHVPQDEQAIEVMQSCFPAKNIIPINCRALIKQHGSLHCITMQLPKGVLG